VSKKASDRNEKYEKRKDEQEKTQEHREENAETKKRKGEQEETEEHKEKHRTVFFSQIALFLT
jgi:hypothetical protein